LEPRIFWNLPEDRPGQTRKDFSVKLAEFSGLLVEYEKWKLKNKWKDREDLYVDALALPAPSTTIWTYGFMTRRPCNERFYFICRKT